MSRFRAGERFAKERVSSASRRITARHLGVGLVSIAVAVMALSAQAALFYHKYAPEVTQSNRLLLDLVHESSQRTLYNRIATRFQDRYSITAQDELTGSRAVWNGFHDHFVTAPVEAIRELRAGPAVKDAKDAVLSDDLTRLEEIYTDRYAPLLEELQNPPLLMWPMAPFLASHSGYLDAITLNRALYLAQVDQIGTARLILTGLRATTDNPEIVSVAYYILARLQYELFRSRPEAEYYLQALEYLRQSLRANENFELSKRLLDYLLSLKKGKAAQRAGEGRPTTPSDGEGAAISGDKRRF